MRTITLTDEQREQVLKKLIEWRQDEDIDCIVELDDMEVTVTGHLEIDSYCEDDYYTGTGAWIETYRSANIDISAWLWKEDEFVEVDVDTYSACVELLEELN